MSRARRRPPRIGSTPLPSLVFRQLAVTDVRDMASIKTDVIRANLQLTVARATRKGGDIWMLDADIDENANSCTCACISRTRCHAGTSASRGGVPLG